MDTANEKPEELDLWHNGLFRGQKPLEDYIGLLDKYLVLAPYLLPKDANSPLNWPTLRHQGTLFHEAHRTELTKQT